MKAAFRYAFRHSIPILISFIPVGLAYGLLMQTAGYNWIWTGASCLFIFAGSLQFLAVSFFAGDVSIVTVIIMALLLNSRHIFYGIPFIEKWRSYGKWRLFLIYSLADEAFSLHCSNTFDDGNDKHKKWTYIFEAAFTLGYWFILSVLGALAGSLIRFNTEGIDFALTALFIVILIDQIKSSQNGALPAILAAGSSIACLLIIGPSGFILPSLMITVVLLIVFRQRMSTKGVEENE